MVLKSNWQRLMECYRCEYLDICTEEIADPQDNPDGSCKQKEIYRVKEEKNENHI